MLGWLHPYNTDSIHSQTLWYSPLKFVLAVALFPLAALYRLIMHSPLLPLYLSLINCIDPEIMQVHRMLKKCHQYVHSDSNSKPHQAVSYSLEDYSLEDYSLRSAVQVLESQTIIT